LEHKSVSQKKFSVMILYTIAGSVLTAIAAIFIFPLFIDFTIGEAFRASYQPFLFLLPGVVLFSINILLAARLAGKGNVFINMQGAALCFIIILILDLWLIPQKSSTGAAIASSIGYGSSTLFVIFKYRNWIKN
jgi:O-antigen/teichoic acid export membrane protein